MNYIYGTGKRSRKPGVKTRKSTIKGHEPHHGVDGELTGRQTQQRVKHVLVSVGAPLEKRQILGLKQGKEKRNPEHLVMPESGASPEGWRRV